MAKFNCMGYRLDPITDDEFEQMVRESGMIDGVFHHGAAIVATGDVDMGWYPDVFETPDDTPVSWVELFEDGIAKSALVWSGDPITHLEADCISDFGFRATLRLRAFAEAGLPMEEARQRILDAYDHGPIQSGYLPDYAEKGPDYDEPLPQYDPDEEFEGCLRWDMETDTYYYED